VHAARYVRGMCPQTSPESRASGAHACICPQTSPGIAGKWCVCRHVSANVPAGSSETDRGETRSWGDETWGDETFGERDRGKVRACGGWSQGLGDQEVKDAITGADASVLVDLQACREQGVGDLDQGAHVEPVSGQRLAGHGVGVA